jgi:hypothetical protein
VALTCTRYPTDKKLLKLLTAQPLESVVHFIGEKFLEYCMLNVTAVTIVRNIVEWMLMKVS